MSPRLFVCADTRPWPPDRGDRLRYAHFVDALRSSHEVRLAFVRREAEAAQRPAAPGEVDLTLSERRVAWNALRGAFTRAPVQFSAFGDTGARARVRAAAAGYDAFVALGARAGLYRDAFAGPGPAILDLQDSLVLNARAQWAARAGVARTLYGADNLAKAAMLERKLVHGYDLVLVAGKTDHDWVTSRYPGVACRLVPTAVPVPDEPAPIAPEPLLLFLGDLRFAPNVDAVRHLVEDVWPRVRSLQPNAKLRVVGHAPAPPLARLLASSGVETAYSVPDVQPHLRACRALIAPMRIGSGVKVKVLQAMAAGRAVVMTPHANEGVGATDGAEARIARTPEELASAAAALLSDESVAATMGRAGWALVSTRFSPAAVSDALHAALGDVLAS